MMCNKCRNFQSIHLDNDGQAVFIPLGIVRLPEIKYLIPSCLDSHSSIIHKVAILLQGIELYWTIVLQQKTYPELHVCLVVVLPLAQVTLQIRVPTLHGVASNYQQCGVLFVHQGQTQKRTIYLRAPWFTLPLVQKQGWPSLRVEVFFNTYTIPSNLHSRGSTTTSTTSNLR